MKRLQGCVEEHHAYINWRNTYHVAMITYRINDACEEEYVITPDWTLIDALRVKFPSMTSIEGIRYGKERRAEYVRDHVPYFIKGRIPPRNRDNIGELLLDWGLDHYNAWDIIAKTKGITHDEYTFEAID